MSEIRVLKDQIETRPIRTTKQYIQEHYHEPLKLEEISKMVGFNSTYFSGLFKKETGKNFSDYLMEVRFNRAKELLIEEDMPIADIAEEVGYCDLKYFSKIFKREMGINPSKFRELYRKLR